MKWCPLAGIYVFALSLRLLYIFISDSLPGFRTLVPGLDSDVYWRAAALLNNPVSGSPNWELKVTTSPFFVWWLSLVQGVLGESVLTYRVFQAFVSPFSAIMVYLIVSKVLKNQASAIIAALAFAAAPVALHFDTTIAKPNLEMPLFAAIGGLLILYQVRSRGWTVFKYGLLAALVSILCLVQQAMIVLLPILMIGIWLASKSERRTLSILVFCTAFSALFVPARLYQKKSAAWPLSGFNIHLVFNEEANGVYQKIENVSPFLFGHTFDAYAKAQVETDRRLTPQEADRHYWEKTADYFQEKPASALKLMLRKAELFFNSTENKTEEYLPFLSSRIYLLHWNPLNFGFFLIMAVFGVMNCIRARERKLLTVSLGMFSAIFVLCMIVMPSWRYRYSAYFPLALMAAAGFQYLTTLVAAFRNVPVKRRLTDLMLAALVSWIAFREVHTQEYLSRTFAREETNYKNAAARAFWLSDRPLTHNFNEIGSRDPEQINKLCLYHFYSYCYAKAKHAALSGEADLNTIRWYVSYELYRGAFDEARIFLEKTRYSMPEVFENINSKMYQSDIVNKLLRKYVLPAD